MNTSMLLLVITLLMQILKVQCELIKDPTLLRVTPFDAVTDAKILRKEIIDDKNTDNDKIADILFHRTYDQRKKIESYFNTVICKEIKNKYIEHAQGFSDQFKCPLVYGLKRASADSMDNLYNITFTSFQVILGDVLHSAIDGEWKEEGAVEEIVCANDKTIKDFIQEYYKTTYQTTVENHLKSFNKNDNAYQEAILNYCWPQRSQDKKITLDAATAEAKLLQDINPESDKENFKTTLKKFLGKYSEPDLKLIFEKYRKDDHGIDAAVNEAFDGPTKRAMHVLVRYIENTCKFYADELYNAVDGFGTNIDKINRIVVTRCERDMRCILNAFKDSRGKSFTNRLKWDTACEPRYLKSIRYLCGKK